MSKGQLSYVLALDLGGSTLKGGIVDSLAQVRYRTRLVSPVHSQPSAVVEVLLQLLHHLQREAEQRHWLLVGAGVSSTLDVDPALGCFLPPHYQHLEGWEGFPIARSLQDGCGMPVLVENDGPISAWGEYLAGAGKGARSLLMVTLGSGVGGGAVLEGQRLPHTLGRASYFGHMCIDYDGLDCPCGRKGCWECYVSATALEAKAAQAVQKFPGSTCLSPKPSAQEVVSAAQQGDALAASLLAEHAAYLGIGLVDLANIFAPEIIVIGGGLSLAGEGLLAPARQHLNRERYPVAGEVKLVASQLPFEAGLLGAALLALERFGGVDVHKL
jgi:glucokinase